MLTYSFTDIGSDSLYQHLYKCVKNDILSGKISAGTKLPSKRSFAKNLGISTITVETAYAQLIAEGYIYSLPKKGYFVNTIAAEQFQASPFSFEAETRLRDTSGKNANALYANAGSASPSSDTLHSGSNALYSGSDALYSGSDALYSDSAALYSGSDALYSGSDALYSGSTYAHTTKPAVSSDAIPYPPASPYLADFVSNQTNPGNFPFSVWARLLREIITERGSDLVCNPPSAGIMELRTAICEHLRQFRNMDISPEQIIIGAGTEYLYGLLVQLLGYDKVYAVENPGYKKAAQIFRSHHVSCKYARLDHSGICIDSLEQIGADIVHISPGHHYPTGIVTPIGRRYELLAWAARSSSRYIIEDDYDSEFRLSGKPVPMLQSIDVMEKVIYMNTFSKSLASTIRISYMVLPRHLLEQYYTRLSFYACTVSTFEQYTLARFLNEGYFEKHINRMRTYYKNLRNALLDAIKKSPLSSRVTITEEDSGLHFLLKVDTALSDKELVQRAARHGLHIACLSQYYMEDDQNNPALEHTIIMNYSGLRTECLEQAVDQLAKCLL